MFRLRLLSASLALAAWSGCVTYQSKPLSPATTSAQLDHRRLGDEGLRQFLAAHHQPVSEEWDLARLTLAALYFNPEVDLARAQLLEAEAGIKTAEARPNPTFSFSPAYSENTAGGVTPWILGYALNVPIELGHKRNYRTAAARHQAEAARLRLASVAWSARSAARRALTELHAAEATAELWRGQQPLLAQAARLVDAQVGAGDVSPLYAAQARITLNRAELAARESDRAVAIARSRLAEALGVSLAALAEVKISYRGLAEAAAPASAAEARTWAAQNRADLLAELAAYSAAESALQGEIAKQYPNLSLGPGYELDQGQGKWSLGVSVTLPVLDRNQGPIAAATARREVAAARFLALQNRVIGEVDRAASDYASALGDMETIKAMRTSLEQQARTVQAQQQAGETSRLDLVRAQIELADNSRAELEARLRAGRALAAFEDAVQRPLAWPESAWRTGARPLSK